MFQLNLENYLNQNYQENLYQENLITDYGFKGIATYYYWFSENSITNTNMVMQKVINNFFSDSINLQNNKIFFIWTNENWTNNAAFGNTSTYKIANIYNKQNFIKNSENLIKYFKYENYLKIENKPVFFIYHSYDIPNNKINLFYTILNELCKF